MAKILLASTIAPHKLSEPYCLKWLEHYEAMQKSFEPQIDYLDPKKLDVFIAVEIDSRGYEFYRSQKDFDQRLSDVRATDWCFSLDTGEKEVTSGNRYIRICTGRNLAIEYAMVNGYSHILYADTDTELTDDCLPKLLEVDRPLVFGHVPTYCLNGPKMPELPGDCRQHWSSAGFALVRRDAFRHVRWGWDLDGGNTDDPTFARDVELMGKALGEDWRPVTRHDVVGRHWPESILPLEQRDVDRWLW